MIGSVFGDIIGSRFEFMSTQEKEVTLLHSACSWTDDTVLTSAVAQVCSQIKKDNLIDENQIEKLFVTAFKKAVKDFPMAGWGKSFYIWANSKDSYYNDSAGNGCLMRVAPIILYFDNLEDIQKIGRICTKITHNHPDAYESVQAYLEMLHYLMQNIVKVESIKKEKIKEIANKYQINIEPVQKYHEIAGYYGLAKETLPRSLSAYLEGNIFDETMKNVLYIGSDTDTTGTLASTLAELTYSLNVEKLHNLYRYFDHNSFVLLKPIIRGYIENQNKFEKIFDKDSQEKMHELLNHEPIDPTAEYDPLTLPSDEEYYKGSHKKPWKYKIKDLFNKIFRKS